MFKDFTKYEVFEDGRIWSYKKNRFLKPATDTSGYQMVVLYDNEGKRKTYRLNRVVYESVTGEPITEGLQVNHIDEYKTNNHINNLNLMTHKENINFGTRTERAAKALSKQVGAFQNGELVMKFSSTREAERNCFNSGNVAACCRNCYLREGNNIYKGYEWRYL
jgi:hypothetical protein